MTHTKWLLKSTPEDVRATFDTNVFGALHIAQTYAPILARNSGALVNMLSVFSSASGAGAYGASKAALWSARLRLSTPPP